MAESNSSNGAMRRPMNYENHDLSEGFQSFPSQNNTHYDFNRVTPDSRQFPLPSFSHPNQAFHSATRGLNFDYHPTFEQNIHTQPHDTLVSFAAYLASNHLHSRSDFS